MLSVFYIPFHLGPSVKFCHLDDIFSFFSAVAESVHRLDSNIQPATAFIGKIYRRVGSMAKRFNISLDIVRESFSLVRDGYSQA